MEINEERYDRIKTSFGMWMYESFQDLLHVQNFNFAKLGIHKFRRSEIIAMSIAIFNKRVDLELQKAGNGDEDTVV
jgi:3-methyladenine DNA glycosylase/8-oxoguanine DNA glycosylase